MKYTLFIAILLTLCLPHVCSYGQSFNYTLTGNPVNTTGWTLGGSPIAVVNGSTIELNQPATAQNGYIYYTAPQNLAVCANFTVSFDFRIDMSGSNKADGLAFWYLSNPPSGYVGGSNIGMPTTPPPNGLALIIDTYDNISALQNPRVSLRRLNNTNYVEGSSTGQLCPDKINQNSLTNGAWHTCVLTYTSGTVSVVIDGGTPMTGNTVLNFSGYFGFSSSTGAEYSRHSIRNVSISGTIPPVLSATSSVAPLCSGNSTTLTASGATTYSWSPATGLSATTGSTVTANPTVTTHYVVTGTLAGGCSDTTGITITVNPKPIVTVSSTAPANTICNGNSTTLTASGAASYTWSPATGLSATTGTSVTANPTTTTTYTVTGTGANGCTNTSTITITVNPKPTVTVSSTAPANAICNGNSTTLTASGAASYTWSPTTGLSTTTGASVIANPATTTTYTVTGTGVNGCINTSTITITVNPKPTVTVSSTAPLNKICNGNSTTLTAGGAATYTWSPATGLSATTGTSVTATPTTTTTYTVTGTGANGCTNTSTITITVGNPNSSTAFLTKCPSQLPTTWNGITIPVGATSNPVYTTYTTINSVGCDSTVTLNLTISPSVTSTAFLTKCPGQLPTTWNGITIPVGATSNPAYTTYTATNTAGCDSTVTLNLTISPSVTSTAFLTKCPSQLPTTWNGIIIPVGATSNPAYTTYTTTNSAGCDSTVTLNLTISPSVNSTAFLTKCPNQLPTTWNGITIPVGATSNPAYTTFTTTNSAGCDSIVTLNLTINPSVTSTAFLTKCPSQLPTTWNGITIPAGAVSNPAYTTFATTNSAGCDSTVTLNLTVNPSATSTAFLTKCPSQLPTTWNGITIPVGAVSNPAYTTFTTTNSAGCDSTVTLNLTISPNVTSTAFLTKCPSQLPTTWNGITIPAGATSNPAYTTYTTTNTAGCDSTATLNLTINPNVTSTVSLVRCPNQLPATWNGITIPVGAVSNPVYTTYTTTSALGCDSTVTLNLTINPNINNSVTATICNGQTYTFGTQTLSTSGTYTQVFPAANTCDSTVTLALTIKPPPTTNHINQAGCESVTFEGVTYTTSTELENTYTDANGCDSVIRKVHITVKQPVTNVTTADICRGGFYPFNGTNYSNTGTYTATFTAANGCDSISRLELTVHELPVVTLTEQGTGHPHYCLGDTVTLTASGADNYQWWLNNSPWLGVGAIKAVPVYTNNQKVWVEGSDNYGCSDTAEMVIKAQGCCSLMMPNAFSPNGDGMNDKFGPETNGHPKGYAMRIYNRWGQMIYVSYKIEQKWDGTYNGQPAELDTYHYMITGDCASGELIQMKGDITLLR
jgi:gliding motility-associated-like protein